jgi:hypothetical protein
LVQADLTKLAAIDSTAAELNTLDGLSRGSIIYGNASAATAILTKGTVGQVLTSDGTDIAWGDVSGGTSWQSVQTTGFTAVAGEGYPCNTTSAAFTVTLPSSASVGDQVQIVDYAGTFATNNITLTSSLNINGAADDKLLTTNREGVIITYVDVTQGWVATSGVNSGNQALDPTPFSLEMLVIAGGGGGGGDPSNTGSGAGGGAGGYRTSTQTVASGVAITVTVGDGGAGNRGNGTNGSNSSISGSGLTTITSAGGGGGGDATGNFGIAGGSGGGGGGTAGGYAGGLGNTPSTSPSQGNNGSSGSTGNAAGGGGGAGAVGVAASSGVAGIGGVGVANTITGSSVYYAGGGGGSCEGGTDGSGGNGGGGAGSSVTGVAGTVNTGGGGGGAYQDGSGTGGAGGKGVVILSMPDANYTGTTTGSPTVATGVSGKTVLTFTGTGSYTT